MRVEQRYYMDSGDVPMEDKTILSMHTAIDEDIKTVLRAPRNTDDGRSQWLWIRLHNGDLILGCFPQGDTYLAVEKGAHWDNRPKT